MEKRRVVITGMGAVTPIGNTMADSWAAAKAGTCGIGPITRYDTSTQKAKLAGEVKNFDPETLLGKRECKRMDRFTQLALVASDQAMADSGLDRETEVLKQLKDLYEAAVKDEDEKDNKFRASCDEERKAIGAWQACWYGMLTGLIIVIIAVLLFLLCLLGGLNLLLSILCGILGIALIVVFSKQDDKMFEQYASSSLKAMKQAKEQATQHKEELKKYLEAYQGIKAEETSASKKGS